MSDLAHGLWVIQVGGRKDEAADFLPSCGRTFELGQLLPGQLRTCRFVVLAVSAVDDVVIIDRETKDWRVVPGLQEEIEALSKVSQSVVVAVRFAVAELEVLLRHAGIGEIALVEGFARAPASSVCGCPLRYKPDPGGRGDHGPFRRQNAPPGSSTTVPCISSRIPHRGLPCCCRRAGE
jgi:hypothetical protein